MKHIKFGTDGVRGKTGRPPIDEQTMVRIGYAAGKTLAQAGTALIGRDSRASGTILEAAIAKGLIMAGAKVEVAGVVPTAAVSLAVQSTSASMGVMITASHNPASDNGVKLFSANGGKISDSDQTKIEDILNDAMAISGKPAPFDQGAAFTDTVADIYRSKIRQFTSNKPLAGLKLVVDCANGSASSLAPELLNEAGADVIAIHHKPDGNNINENCGSSYTQNLCREVVTQKADVGIAFDGDADRVILVDELGGLIDGDHILARLANDWHNAGKLRAGCVIATVMSNMALEKYLSAIGVRLERVAVGDRHVAARMKELDANLGGEQSGHIMLPDLLASGDGLLAGLLLLLSLAKSTKQASQHLKPFVPNPQLLRNVSFSGGRPLENHLVKTAIEQQQQSLGDTGRLLVRASGTEPLIRIMAEAQTEEQANQAITKIAEAIAKTG